MESAKRGAIQMKIEGKSFIVSGGGSGLGEATARALVARGGRVVIADINAATGEEVATDLGDSARFARTDVTDEVAVRNALELAEESFGRIHGAVSCAGVGDPAKVLGKHGPHSLDLFSRVIQINLVGTFNVLRLAAEAMAENEPDSEGERGVVINTASVAAYEGQIGQAAYAASKGGVVGFTLPAARELARHGIRVMTIAPGLFGSRLLGATGALSVSPWATLGVWGPSPPYFRKSHAQRRGHSTGRCYTNGP
jgi:NAD(P)-dependent dehydrogenase (short-subunit alcohol dehydrogenase family)